MADNIITGRKYRTKDAGNNWSTISFWTKSTDVEMNDGTNLEDNLSDVKIINNQNAVSLNTLNENNNANINNAPLYDETIKYVKGDIIKQNGEFYCCNINMEIPESWDPLHWDEITSVPFKFGIDEFGNYGYIKMGSNSVVPFKGNMQKILLASNVSGAGSISASIIDQKCAEYHINPNKLTKDNFVMEMVNVTCTGAYAYTSPQSSSMISARSLVYNNSSSILSYQTGAWFVGGWNDTTWIHGFCGGYDFYIDTRQRGENNWKNVYYRDTPDNISIVTYSAMAITAVCNIYLLT